MLRWAARRAGRSTLLLGGDGVCLWGVPVAQLHCLRSAPAVSPCRSVRVSRPLLPSRFAAVRFAEYLGPLVEPGKVVKGIRHEDLQVCEGFCVSRGYFMWIFLMCELSTLYV